jgi:hypothetical protein
MLACLELALGIITLITFTAWLAHRLGESLLRRLHFIKR